MPADGGTFVHSLAALMRPSRTRRASQESALAQALGSGEGSGQNGSQAEHSGGSEGFARELDRSRRYGRTFVLIRISTRGSLVTGRRGGKLLVEGDGSDERVLNAFVRRVDYIWSAEGYVYILLPESNRESGEALLERVRREAPEVALEGRAQLVTFPQDGLTSGALIARLDEQLTVLGPTPTPASSTGTGIEIAVVNLPATRE